MSVLELNPPNNHANKTFFLGLPYVIRGPLLKTAKDMGAAVLISANALSVRTKIDGLPQWERFKTSSLHLLDGMDAALDSAGFVATCRYGGYEWPLEAYMDLCAAYPWRFFAALDYCVEPEVAGTREEVLDRISMTVRSLWESRRAASERGIADRLMPVIQGWATEDYARCLDRMSGAIEPDTLLGVGSVCRRHVKGRNGILEVVDRIDRELGDHPARLHLFGVKSDAAGELAAHPRVASFDSQAYGVRARVLAREGGFSKSNVFLAEVMRSWYERQIATIARHSPSLLDTVNRTYGSPSQGEFDLLMVSDFESRISAAREEMRLLVQSGDLESSDLTDARALAWAFDNQDEDENED